MRDDCPAARRLTVVLAKDRYTAWVRIVGSSSEGDAPPAADDLVQIAREAQVAITDAVNARVKELLAQWVSAGGLTVAAAQQPPEGYILAEGRAPVEPIDGQFEWAPELAAEQVQPGDAERVDHFARYAIVTVKEGTVIGRLVAPTPATPGLDVCGQKREPEKAKGLEITLGPGLKLAEGDATQVLAAEAGRVALEGDRLRVYPVLEILGDVDFNSGSIDATVDVHVRGTVRSNFRVHGEKSLMVDRIVEAADIDVAGDVTVRGGIIGREGQGNVHAGGSLSANFVNEITVDVSGDIQFERELLNARIHAGGRVVSAHGTIIGGSVYARNGLAVGVLGSEASVTTVIGVGIDVNVLRRAKQMERDERDFQKSADQVCQMIQPMVANLKRLVPAQRERVTELMAKVDEIETQLAQASQERTQLLEAAAPAAEPCVLVREAIYPGVRLTWGARELRVNTLLHGPLKIEMRKVDEVTEMVAVNQRTGSVTVLLCTEVDLNTPPSEPLLRGLTKHEFSPKSNQCARAGP